MAHEVTKVNGRGEMFSVGETPWHREGVVLAGAPTLEEALELGGLNFDVEKRRVFVPVPCAPDHPAIAGMDTAGRPYRLAESQNAFTVWRTDRDVELGAVGAGYTPIQNRSVFAVMEPLLDQGVLQLETGGSLREGADVWLLGRFDIERFGPVVREIFADEVIPFALFTNNHSGRRGAVVAETPIRVVCANTLGMAEHLMESGKSRAVNVRHTGDAELRVIEAAEELFGGIVERYETIAAQYRALKATHLTQIDFDALVLDAIAPDPRQLKSFNPDAKLAEVVLERALTKRAELTRLWTEGKGHVGDASAWEAYNGAVEALDHNAELWPTRAGSWRTASLMDGQLRRMKDAVLSNLSRHAADVAG